MGTGDLTHLCRALLRCHPDCVKILTPDGRLEFISDNGLAMLDIDDFAEVFGADWTSLWPATEQWKVTDAVARAQGGEVVRFQGRHGTSPKGRPRWWDVFVSPIIEAGAQPGATSRLLCVSRDITPLREAQETQAQSLRLEAIGRLTGGVAHDFNNLLTVMMGASENLAANLEEGSEHQKLAILGLEAADRGADLVRRLLAFARQQPLEAQTLDCAAMVNTLRPLVRQVTDDDVILEITAPVDELYCEADRAQLESALLNLCFNARDAMPSGGRLSVRVDCAMFPKVAAEPLGLNPGPYAIFTVQDTGMGMSPATLARAIEPFFTTKGPTGGSGLGLSTVYGFATQSGGHLGITSHEGEGTTVALYLPRAPRPARAEIALKAAALAAGKGHVLLVEDEAAIRAQVAQLLTELGYDVTAVRDGQAALAALAGDGLFDLLFTDVVMPNGMTGPELADQAWATRPDLKVLFTSGYAEEAVFEGRGRDRSTNFLAKPYHRAHLASAVATVIAQRPVRVPSWSPGPARRVRKIRSGASS
jgi:signal transduction histidine kinase/CheY-like chemotaxis protein